MQGYSDSRGVELLNGYLQEGKFSPACRSSFVRFLTVSGPSTFAHGDSKTNQQASLSPGDLYSYGIRKLLVFSTAATFMS